VSGNEKKLIHQIIGELHTAPNSPVNNKLCVVPNGVDLSQYTWHEGAAQPCKMIFAGSITYGANFDAVYYFLREIMPLIKVNYPTAQLVITGKTDQVRLDRLPVDESVKFTGYLNDIQPEIASAWVQIVPLRIGGGTRLKILESLAIGTPVISTTKGAEGLDFVPGQDILIADTPEEFANSVIQLFSQPLLRHRLSLAGHQAVSQRYDWNMIGNQFLTFIDQFSSSS
jgi:glycosyltransferase involved in cell wall biosynthesis